MGKNHHVEKGAVDERLDRLENVLGKMCGVYQATMECFAHLANAPQAQPGSTPLVVPATPPAPAAAPPAKAEPAVKKSVWDPVDLESVAGDTWMDYHGREGSGRAEEEKNIQSRCLNEKR